LISVSADAPLRSKRTVPSTESAVNLSIADPERVAVPLPICGSLALSRAVPEIVVIPDAVYAGV